MQDSAMKFFNKYQNELTNNINSCMLCKITKYDHKEMKAEVLPLIKYTKKDDSTEDRTLLIEVPIMHMKVRDFYIRPPYQVGDIVVVGFFDEDTDNAIITGATEEANSTRKHSLDDAVIIGSLRTLEKAEYPDIHKDDLLITNEKETFKIVIKPDGEIEVNSDKKITFNSKEQVQINGPSQTSTWN